MSNLAPCHSPYCECDAGKCTHPGFFDARHLASIYQWQWFSEWLDGEKLPDSLNRTIHGLCDGTLIVVPKEGT